MSYNGLNGGREEMYDSWDDFFDAEEEERRMIEEARVERLPEPDEESIELNEIKKRQKIAEANEY